MTPIHSLLRDRRVTEGGFSVTIPNDWMQGRTVYGGLSAALALQAALELEDDLPPLRSAQIAFIGPLSGALTVRAQRLRRGRNACFVQADVSSEVGLGLRATFIFMQRLPSAISHDVAPRAPIAPPPPGTEGFIGPDSFFIGNFALVDHNEGLGEAQWLRWSRLRDRSHISPFVEMLAIGDSLPPAALKLFDTMKVPVSSMNWQINFLTDAPATGPEGWWLLDATADTANGGYSSQRMTIWNMAGEPVAEAMQGVALFG